MNRKEFIGISSSALAFSFLNAHWLFASSDPALKKPTDDGNPLIRSIRLQTTTLLATMKKFYTETIGLRVTSEFSNELIIEAGKSLIIFEYVKQENFRPFYHFAFNIPENKIEKAFDWQRKRTPVIHPNPEFEAGKITHFPHWNAHSIFFLDPAGNLLEYIARHDLNNGTDGDFSRKDILYVSEIGFVTVDVIKTGNNLMKALEIAEYRNGSSGLWPIGDEQGLLLMLKKGSIWTSNPGQTNETDIFKTEVKINKPGKNIWSLPNHPYQISG